MTDSMKFGPEWLRNMSAEHSNSTSVGGGGTSSGSPSTASTSISSFSSTAHSAGAGSTTLGHTPAQRNMFPEFRYGREEMLSLFDKNCLSPQILMSYKTLFVEKVQYPLALTPFSEEEMGASQAQAANSIRPTWMQRSSIGFGTSLRGTGRGGAVDRGRLRGKPSYHSSYQRPAAAYEDGVLVSPLALKSERGWSERNGTSDTTTGVAGAAGGGSAGVDWNGTPASSPRKEYSSHHRNMENWRRSRAEDGSGDGPNAGGGNLAGTDGWRSGTSSGGGAFISNHRWARSTSWRDDEGAPSDGLAYSNSGGGSSVAMQRSFSTIGTVGSERGNTYTNNLGKNSGSATSTNRQQSVSSQSSKGNHQWSGGTGVGGDIEDNLPEWAMENPSDVGGTFDATGAFHGDSPEEEYLKKNKPHTSSSDEKELNNDSSQESNIKETDSVRSDMEKMKLLYKEETVAESSDEQMKVEENKSMLSDDGIQKPHESDNLQSAGSGATGSVTPEVASTIQKLTTETHGDISDRLKEVADEVEKLIMDDDGGDVDQHKSNSTGSVNINSGGDYVAPALVAMLKQQSTSPREATSRQQVPTHHPENILLPGLGEHKTIPYAEQLVMQQQQHIQHHQQAQLAAVAAAAAAAAAGLPSHMVNSNPNDLWYYRDPQSNVQGPFSALEMTEWYRAGYFNENLFVRRFCDNRFRPLGELIKLCHGNMPFTHSQLIPPVSGMELATATNKSQVALNDQHAVVPGPQSQNNDAEQLKGHVTAAADFLSAAVKNHINTVDMSHMLTLRFQMLQEQYMQHEEHVIVAELSKHEWFQRLTPVERENVVRQKVQMLVLPEYLSSLSGLSNSLATLNPIAGNQLYDAIAQHAKKNHQPTIFTSQTGPQPQQRQAGGNYMEADDFIMNAQLLHQQTQQASKPQQQQQNHQQPSGSSAIGQQHFGGAPPQTSDANSNKLLRGPADDLSSNDILNEYNLRMFLRGGATGAGSNAAVPPHPQKPHSAADFITEPQILSAAAQNIMLPLWLPQYSSAAAAAGSTQSQMLASHHQPQPTVTNHWGGPGGNPLVRLPGAAASADTAAKPPMPGTLWDVSVLEESQQMLQQQKQRAESMLEHNLNFNESPENAHPLQNPMQQQNEKLKDQAHHQICSQSNVIQQQQQSKPLSEDQPANQLNQQQITKVSSSNVSKQQQQIQQHSLMTKSKQDSKVLSEEDRRREQGEEKRRQKEERKRQQIEEEKRRVQQVEEEKRRQLLEEKERQQQIQAQRRKALLGNSSSANAVATSKTATAKGEQQPRSQSHGTSIAPWSLQTTVSNSAGPGLAEIQKAERRERRADLQRQQEQLDKQVRANAAAAAEANDAMLKWQASPAPTTVMSLAEIQAEEAKRLANELQEQQRRREQEQQQQQTVLASSGLVSSVGVGVGLSNIWGGNATKAWSGPTTNIANVVGANGNPTGGFWEDSTVSSVKNNTSGFTTAAAIVAAGNKQQQQKSTVSPSTRNLRKSQTVPSMQTTKVVKAQPQPEKKSAVAASASKSQKSIDDKKAPISKVQATNSNKAAEYENEFNGWCMKSLANMSAKVDVPTFVNFLQDLEAPYEVKDYVRMYLGEGKESTEFAKQFLERRSKYKNLQRAQNAHNDDMCKPAPAITPSGNDNSDSKNKQKKIKKNKMTKLDARILGFSVTAAEGRVNVGARDYGDGL